MRNKWVNGRLRRYGPSRLAIGRRRFHKRVAALFIPIVVEQRRNAMALAELFRQRPMPVLGRFAVFAVRGRAQAPLKQR